LATASSFVHCSQHMLARMSRDNRSAEAVLKVLGSLRTTMTRVRAFL
jgi:predicted lipid-binding transport protein (Tim44 family)